MVLAEAGGLEEAAWQQMPAHYGAPLPEQRALFAGEAYCDLPAYTVLSLTGEDHLSWLHSLTTQELTGLGTHASSELLLLNPQGHIENFAGVLRAGDQTFLICEPGYGAAFAEYLTKMRFRMRVDIQWVRAGVIGVQGKAREIAQGLAERYGAMVWHDPWPQTPGASAFYGASDEDHPGAELPVDLILVPEESREAFCHELDAAGLRPAGALAWEALRVRRLRPRLGREVDGRALPHELDWLRSAVHLHKGCYRGQEAVAKLVNLGKPPRRLVKLYLEGDSQALPPSGTPVTVQGRPAGAITSACLDWEEGPVALALIKRNVPLEVTLEVGDFTSAQSEIVRCDGRSNVSPQERPGAELRKRGLGTRLA